MSSAELGTDRELSKLKPSIGAWFPFQGREVQCVELLRAFYQLDELRGKPASQKRALQVPVCLGMPGIGKSRFAREVILHLAKLADRDISSASSSQASSPGSAAQPAAASTARRQPSTADVAGWIVNKVWGTANIQHHNYVCELLRACDSSRNLRLDMFKFGLGHGTSMSPDLLGRMLLVEWALAYHREHVISECKGSRESLMRFLAERYPLVDLLDVLKLILGWSPPLPGPFSTAEAVVSPHSDKDGDGVPALILNLDEAHLLGPEAIRDMLNHLASAILQGFRLCVVVTGMQDVSVTRAIDASNVGFTSVHLPLLQEQHVRNIMEAFRPRDEERGLGLNNYMAEAAWWAGGVPRFLELMFFHVAESALQELQDSGTEEGQGDVDCRCVIWHKMKAMESTGWAGVFQAALAQTRRSAQVSMIPVSVLAKLLAFAVSGISIPVSLGTDNCQFGQCMLQQQRMSRCSLQYPPQGPSASSAAVVQVPPCVLSLYFSQMAMAPYSLRERLRFPAPPNFSPFAASHPADNELRTVVAIACRLLALHLHPGATAGSVVPLYRVLGYESNPAYPAVEFTHVPPAEWTLAALLSCEVQLPQRRNLFVEVSSVCLEGAKLVDRIRGMMGIDRAGGTLPDAAQLEPIAWVNGRNARSCADGFIVFHKAVILIQEKQSTGARLKAACSASVVKLGEKVVQAEVAKMEADVKTLREAFPKLPVLCLLVSDAEIEASHILPAYCMPCGASALKILLGDTIARVRAFARAESAAAAQSHKQTEVGHMCAAAPPPAPDECAALKTE